ncbi:MAG: uridine kinase [Rhodoglobus sp.]
MAEPIPLPSAATARRDLLDSLSDEFLHNYGRGRTLLAIDGTAGAGTSTFADALAMRMGRGGHSVFRASIDHFRRSHEASTARTDDSVGGFYRDSFDYDLFRRVLIGPFRLGGSTGFVTAAFDVERDAPVEMKWQTGPRDATLIIDGAFLNRPELRGLWNFSVWLESGVGSSHNAQIESAHALYAAESSPRTRATAIIDNSIPELPRRVFADSC